MTGILEDRLDRLDTLYRRYNGPIPKDILAVVDAGDVGTYAARVATADLQFWRRYLRRSVTAYRRAPSTRRRAHIAADIRTAWPAYRRAARLQGHLRQIATESENQP